eukprot:GEZU01036491.1.p1 GENE.GEZU01036491.1~~GEZU01036491.1.p1  ORF type:complete len:298 (+),score=38.95 GEZU01036491.1:3-896(+)
MGRSFTLISPIRTQKLASYCFVVLIALFFLYFLVTKLFNGPFVTSICGIRYEYGIDYEDEYYAPISPDDPRLISNSMETANKKMALIFPYRDRAHDLAIAAPFYHMYLKKLGRNFQIFVIEQSSKGRFNRAKLFNVGFDLTKDQGFDYWVFQDIDMLPVGFTNKFEYPEVPTHLVKCGSQFGGRLPYKNFVGGGIAFNKDDFLKINGASNRYWGWGGEDDDIYLRIRLAGLELARLPGCAGQYESIHADHARDKGNNDVLLKQMCTTWRNDGLSDLQYSVVKRVDEPLFTRYIVDLV